MLQSAQMPNYEGNLFLYHFVGKTFQFTPTNMSKNTLCSVGLVAGRLSGTALEYVCLSFGAPYFQFEGIFMANNCGGQTI